MNIDDIDRLILNELQTNGRQTNADLAAAVGLSPSATLRRVRALEDGHVIENYVTLINRNAGRQVNGRCLSRFRSPGNRNRLSTPLKPPSWTFRR